MSYKVLISMINIASGIYFKLCEREENSYEGLQLHIL